MGALAEVPLSPVTLLADARITGIPVRECGDPLCEVDDGRGGRVLVRQGVAERLACARRALTPEGRLVVHEGLRRPERQDVLFATYLEELRRRDPRAEADVLYERCSRFVAPPEVAPHVAGAAIDVSLVDWNGQPVDLGTPVDASPESSDGACCFDAAGISASARRARGVLADALHAAGFVNYPTEWWHWSYGDRYWAYVVGAPAAIYGPVVGGDF